MKKTLVATALLASMIGPAAASEETDAMVPVTTFMERFNQGDWPGVLAACSQTTAIVDNFPPHAWQGTGA